jgi:hypothetical protein
MNRVESLSSRGRSPSDAVCRCTHVVARRRTISGPEPTPAALTCADDLFEDGLTSEWQGTTGSFSTTEINTTPWWKFWAAQNWIWQPGVLALNVPGIVPGRQTIVPSTGWPNWPGPFDPYVAGLPIVNAGTQALLLGSDADSASTGMAHYYAGNAESITRTFIATTQSFRFAYAVVLDDNGHPPNQQPFFEVLLRYPALPHPGNLPQTIIRVVAGDPYLKTGGALPEGGVLQCRPWDCYTIDLSAHQGQPVEVIFITAHCAFGPHFCYAYIDGFCEESIYPSFTIPATVCMSSGPSVVADGSASHNETDYFWSVQPTDANGVGIPNTELSRWFNAAQAGPIDIGAFYQSLGGTWQCNTNYRVKLAVKNHCVAWKELVKTIFVSCPQVTAGADACVSCDPNGQVIQLGVGNATTPGLSYHWSPSTGLDNPSLASPLHTQGSVAYPITYTVTVTESVNHCSSSDQVTLYCEAPKVELAMVLDCCAATLTASGSGGYQTINWSMVPHPGQASVPLQSDVLSIVVTHPGTYTVTVGNPCGSATASVVVPAVSGMGGFFNPIAANSLFTPGSGSPSTTPRDKLYIMDVIAGGGTFGAPNAYNATDYKLEIFDRWGTIVKTITDHNCDGFANWSITWDGTNNSGDPVQEGVYSWLVHFQNCQYPKWTLPKIREFAPRYCVKWFSIFHIHLWCTGYNVPAGTTIDVDLVPQAVTVV